MTLATLLPARPDVPLLRRITVGEYHRMIDAGILTSGEPYELLTGMLVLKNRSAAGEDRNTVGREHLWAVKNLARIGRRLDRLGCHMQTQGPVIMSDFDEPEPDGVILIGTEDDYRLRKPEARDATCVIEVADSSLDHDRTHKLSVYANSAVPQYVIIDLPDRLIEVYAGPQVGQGRYARIETIRPGADVIFAAVGGRELVVPAGSLLP